VNCFGKFGAPPRRALLQLTAVCVLVTASVPALAQSAPSEEAVAEQRRLDAKTKYEQGVEAYRQGRYTEAVEQFLAADRLAPSAPLSFNIAKAYEKLRDTAGALRWYRDYLRRDPQAKNATEVGMLVKSLAKTLSEKGVQQVTVISTPVGATVLVDDRPVGVTPWTGQLPPGKHQVLLNLRGYADAQREVDLPVDAPLDVSVRLEEAKTATPSPAANGGTTTIIQNVAPTESPKERKGLGPWPWISFGVGGAALGGALVFELMRRSAESDAKDDPTQVGFSDSYDAMERNQTVSRVLLGVGGAFVVAGGVMLAIDLSSRSKTGSSGNDVSIAFGTTPAGGGAVQARGRF
jgi:hypothetical protein